MNLSLRFVTPAELDQWLATGIQPGVVWHHEYPMTDSLVGVRMLRLADAGDHPWGFWEILVTEGYEAIVIGDIGFHGPPGQAGTVEIGYEIVPAWRRRGVATWAVREILQIAAQHGISRVEAEVYGDNPGSSAVLRTAGFTQVDETSDRTVWRRSMQATATPLPNTTAAMH